MWKTSVGGVVWWEDFHEEESEGLLPVLHLSSDWPSSPQVAPYECRAHPLRAWLRHPGYAVCLRLPATLRPSGGAIRVGQRWARSRAICMAAHGLGWLTVRAVRAVASIRNGLSGGAGQQRGGVWSWAGGLDER